MHCGCYARLQSENNQCAMPSGEHGPGEGNLALTGNASGLKEATVRNLAGGVPYRSGKQGCHCRVLLDSLDEKRQIK